FFFKQKTAYEISRDWSSDVCSSDLEVRVNHIALDGPRPHDRHFDYQIVELPRPQPWQHVHLRPAFDLEYANGISLAQHVINRRKIGRASCRERESISMAASMLVM